MKMSLTEFSKLTSEQQELARSMNVELTLTKTASPEARKAADARKGKYFTLELYPEDPHHVEVLRYIEEHEHVHQYLYILHDRDCYDAEGVHKERNESGEIVEVQHNAGDSKKPHWHVMVKWKTATVANSVAKFYTIDKAFKVENPESMALYFLHDTLESQHKARYNVEELHGSKKMLDLCAKLKFCTNEAIDFVGRAMDGDTLAEIVMDVATSGMTSEEINNKIEFILSHGAFAAAITNQQISARKRRTYEEGLAQEAAKIVREERVKEAFTKAIAEAYRYQNAVQLNFEEGGAGVI